MTEHMGTLRVGPRLVLFLLPKRSARGFLFCSRVENAGALDVEGVEGSVVALREDVARVEVEAGRDGQRATEPRVRERAQNLVLGPQPERTARHVVQDLRPIRRWCLSAWVRLSLRVLLEGVTYRRVALERHIGRVLE